MTTIEEYYKDKANFYAHDARYTEDADMIGESSDLIVYKKRITFCTEDEKIWGTWHEECTVRREPIYRVISTRKMGENVFEQTVEQIGETIYEDIEYFAYGEGYEHSCKSKYVHSIHKRMFSKEVA